MVADCICEAREQVKSHVSAGQTEGAEDRNFADSIRKARQQVAAHGNAGQDHFADVRKMIPVGKDGQPYWSARDLANLFGYSDWRNFADCIRKAREQVASHVSAGQPGSGSVNGFENAERITTNNLGKPRTIPDVHLTRFAAYFVALNADQ